MLLELCFVAVYALHAGVTFWSLAQLKRFPAETPAIRDERCLQRYKDFVRTQMYLALIMIGMLVPFVVVGVLMVGRYGLLGLGLVIVANAWMFGLGMYHRAWEQRARRLEVASETLGREYHRVSEVWVKKPLPNF